MDREAIAVIVGELYLNNQILTRKLEEANKELERLRSLVEQLSGTD